MFAIRIKNIIRISNNFRLKNKGFLNSFEFKKISAKPFCDFFDKDSPYVKEAGDKIYPKVTKGSVEKYMQEIYEDYKDALELYSKKDLNSAYTKSNLILNDAMLFKDHILPLFVYNLLGKIQTARGEIKSAVEKFEKAESYYDNKLKLKSENYYLSKGNIALEAQGEDVKNNWQQIISCMKDTYVNLGYLYNEEKKNEKSNEKLIYLLDNFQLEKGLEYFKILSIISLNFSSFGNHSSATSYCNRILNEQSEFTVVDAADTPQDVRDQFYAIIARTFKQIAAIKDFNKEDPKNILSFFKNADLCYDKCVNKDMQSYISNLYWIGQFSQSSGEYNISNEYCEKLNNYIQSKNEKSIENEMNKLRLDCLNLIVVNHSKLEKFENLIHYLIEYLSLYMKIKFENEESLSQEENIRANFLFLIHLFEKNYSTLTDQEKMTKSMYICLSQFLNWKLIPQDSIDVSFYKEKLDTILTFFNFCFEKNLFDSEYLEIIEKVMKKIYVISRTYDEEIKDLKLKMYIISINIELIKLASKKNSNLKEKLSTTFLDESEVNQNLKEINSIINSDIKEEIKIHINTHPTQSIEHLILLIKNMIKILDKNNKNPNFICEFSDKLLSYIKDVLRREEFKIESDKFMPVLNELSERISTIK